MEYLQTSVTSLPPDRGEREATSKAFRRRSSTSDALRFREKLQELSRSADMHDDMMGESPREHTEQETSPSPDETAAVGNEAGANTNSNNNSPVDSVSLLKEGERHQTTRPSLLFNAKFRSHVRASSDTTTITYNSETLATSKLAEVHTSKNVSGGVRNPVPQVGTHDDTTEKVLPPAPGGPRENVLTVPGGGVDKNSKSPDTDSIGSVDPDRKSAIVDVGYDL